MTVESVLRSADQAANAALDIVLCDTGNFANSKLQEVLVLCKDFRQRSYYLDYFRVRRKLENVDAIWLQRAVQRINLAIFTAAVWSGDADDLEQATKDYFTKVIPRSLECTDKIVDAYLEVQMQLAFREIMARMKTAEEMDAMDVINVYFPKKLIDYNLPANKSGKERVLVRAERIVKEFYDKIGDNITEDMERRFPKIRMRKTWQTALIMDIDGNLELIESPDEEPEEEPTSPASVAPQEQKDIPENNTTRTTKPADPVSQSPPNEDTHDDSDFQPKDDEDDDDHSTASDSSDNNSKRMAVRKRNAAQPPQQGKEKLRKLTERWTSEETEALKKGYQDFGFGQWERIKSKYSKQLQNRTIQQLKDKSRNIAKAMEKNGQPLGKWEPALRRA